MRFFRRTSVDSEGSAMSFSSFRKSSRRHNIDSWAINSITSNINTDEKREFCDSMSSQETTPWSPHCSFSSTSHPSATSHSNKGVDRLTLKVQLLESQLQRKDETISQLLQAEDERAALLERQLERLVELSSSRCAAHQGTTFSLDSKKVKRQSITSGDCDSPRDAELEISALEELLARVIAEKDRLASQNQSLKRLLKESDNDAGPSSERDTGGIKKMPSKMPSTIDQLESAIHTRYGDSMTQDEEHKKKCQKYKCRDTINWHDECQRDSPKEDANEKCDTKKNVHAAAEEQIAVQISCRKSPRDHSHLKYSTDDTLVNLAKSLKMKYAQVWKMVQQHQDDGGSISSSVHDDEWSKEIDFSSSSLARHLVKHCQSMSSEDDVLKWCMTNIKVEIEKKM